MKNPPLVLDFGLKKKPRTSHSFLLIFLDYKRQNVGFLSVKEFFISYFVTQPSVAIVNSSEIWTDSWKTWRILGADLLK